MTIELSILPPVGGPEAFGPWPPIISARLAPPIFGSGGRSLGYGGGGAAAYVTPMYSVRVAVGRGLPVSIP